LLGGRATLEKAGLLVPVIVAGVAGDVVDELGAEGDFQLLNSFQAQQTQLLIELVAVQDIIKRGTLLKVGRARAEEAAPLAAEPIVADVGQVAQGPRFVCHHQASVL